VSRKKYLKVGIHRATFCGSLTYKVLQRSVSLHSDPAFTSTKLRCLIIAIRYTTEAWSQAPFQVPILYKHKASLV